MTIDDDEHGMTVKEFDDSTRGFYEVLERIADAIEWIAEDMYRARNDGADRTRPPHMQR